MRRAVALVLSAGLLASLVACTAEDSNDGACATTGSGSASEAVKASGDFGTEPTVTFDSPLSTETTERSVLIEGDGKRQAAPGEFAVIDFAIYNGSTGERSTGSGYDAAAADGFLIDPSMYLTGLISTLQCSVAGDRLVGVIPPAEAFGAGSEQLGIGAEDSLVFVADVREVLPGRAEGKSVSVDDSTLPAVKLAEDGAPTITIPDTAPPAELKLAVLKQGDGATVTESDAVWMQYQGVNWTTKAVFDQTWGQRPPTKFSADRVVEGFAQGFVGQKVGSQILVVIPPELGYGPQGGNGDIGATDTIVFVIDILGVAPAAAAAE